MLTSVASIERFVCCEIGPPLERVASRRASTSTFSRLKRRQLRRLDADVPEVRHRGIEDERAQRVFGGGDLACATMTASSRAATSDSASTMSIGGVVPISTRERVLRSDSCARSSDCCCDAERRHRVGEIPIGVAHRARRRRRASAEDRRRRSRDSSHSPRAAGGCCRWTSRASATAGS